MNAAVLGVLLSGLALFVLFVTMATIENGSVGRSSAPWWFPFRWIILAPIVSVPLSAALFEMLAGNQEPEAVGLPASDAGCSWFCSAYEYAELNPTLIAFTVPGVVNLVAFAWVLSKEPRVRIAAMVAGLLGLLRLSVPTIVLLLIINRLTNGDGVTYVQWDVGGIGPSFPIPMPHFAVWLFGAAAWFGSLLVWGLLFDRYHR